MERPRRNDIASKLVGAGVREYGSEGVERLKSRIFHPRTPAPPYPHTSSLPTIIGLLIILSIIVAAPLYGEEPAASSREPAATHSEPTAAVDAHEAEKQRQALAGLLALCGILIGGLALVVLVIIWGARLRRMARRELPAQKTLQNELWFLKPPKSPPE